MWVGMQKGTGKHVHPSKTQIRLHICAVRSESSSGALLVAKALVNLQPATKTPNQTMQMCCLI